MKGNLETIPEKLLKPYDPASEEKRLYEKWEQSGYFNPEKMIADGLTKSDATPFTIVLPPPNVTGNLHMGHAMMLTVQDILIRYHRMKGDRTLWIPGTDHAAIATQSKVEKEIQKKEGKSRYDLGREELLKRIATFAQESHDTIIDQTKAMGASLDWSREAFTLDEKRTLAVRTAFKKMYDDGLIYRGNRIVNWDPKGQTTISDDEIVYESRKSKLYTFKYSKDFPISISTTRPETKVGDVAVAVHPDDARYAEFAGKEYDANFCGVLIHIKIVADASVEKDFGTGALGVTPAHALVDWDIADRHNLPRPQVINEYAKMMVGDERLLGKKTTEAREIVVEWLRNEGLLEKEEDIEQNVATAERTSGIIEPLPKLQWFINVNKPIPDRGNKTLKELMREPVANDEIKITPEYYDKTYFHWIDNLRDWCISRQIWYGHRIPVWYSKTGESFLPKERKIIFVRHGESTDNLQGIYPKDDAILTDNGKQQAEKIANELISKDISKILCSDLSRAIETAEIINKKTQVPVSYLKELREVASGELEGLPSDQGSLLVAAFKNKTGETCTELVNRAKNVWDLIEKDSDNGTLLIVGHQSFLSVLKAVHEGITEENKLIEYRNNWKLDNADIYEFSVLTNPDDENLTQDEDTLDTWFSSGLWTFSTLGWPDVQEMDRQGFSVYHPTTVLETGPDILFFWVARMILMSEYCLGTIPFKQIYLHGLVRDQKGQKMSKSLGNAMDPMDIAQKYGADAGRMALIFGTAPGTESKISEDKIKGMKHFANKLWNITRFVLSNIDKENIAEDSAVQLTPTDSEKLNQWKATATLITTDLENMRLHTAAENTYNYIWAVFADQIIEESKPLLASDDATIKNSRQALLYKLLVGNLKLLHPFMPFVTEALWELVGEIAPRGADAQNHHAMLMVTPWDTL